MIKEIKIENFKSIESLNLELGRLNVFIGANGSGKSNILEGIAFGGTMLTMLTDSYALNNILSSKGIRITDNELMVSAFKKQVDLTFGIGFTDTELDKISFRLIYRQDKQHFSPEIHMSKDFWELDENQKTKNKLVRTLPNFASWDENIVDEEIIYNQKTRKKYLEVHEAQRFLIFAPENNFLRNFREEAQITPIGIRGEGLFSHIAYLFKNKPNLFKKINENLELLDWFDGFEIPNDLMFTERRIKIKDRFLEDGLQYFDQRSANEGFLYLLFYLTLFISDETPKFFAIDNIDNAMNPKMGNELVHLLAKLAKEHDKQVILTTHNPSVLDGLDLSDDDQRLFVISRNKKGHTKALRVPYRETEDRLSYLFIRGSIGGLPKNF